MRESETRVTGGLKYVDDFVTDPATLHGAYVRLPCARARVRSINAETARNVPGVVGIFTAADIERPIPRYGVILMDQPILAREETRFYGEPVAIVLAEDAEVAKEAAHKVDIDYEVLSPVLTAEDALAPDAPLVLDPELRPDDPNKNTNTMTDFGVSWGTVPEADSAEAEECALILENTYRAPYVHHFALEPYTSVAIPEDDGIAIVTAIQHPFQLRRIVASMLDMPQSKVRVHSVAAGGGFGGRGYPKIEPAAAYFALRLGKPVKISLTAEEGFMVAQREASRIHIRTGFDGNGRLVFQDILVDFCMGAYTDVAPRVVKKTAVLAGGPYNVPHLRTRCRGLYTHTAPTTAFRGFGAPHAAFAFESQMNEAASSLGIDPAEIRLRNLAERGDEFVPGDTPADGDWKSAVRVARDAMDVGEPLPEGHGRGMAVGIKNTVANTTSFARVHMNADGSITAYVGTAEIGQGSWNTMAKIVSDALSVPLEMVTVIGGDTSTAPFDFLTASSRSTVTMGNALLDACTKIETRLKQIARDRCDIAGEKAKLENAQVVDGSTRLGFAELLTREFGPGLGELEYEGVFQSPKDPGSPLGGKTPFYEYLVTVVEVAVDEDTGEVILERLVNVSDVGKALNPRRVAGLDEGGAVMGIGAAMMEHLVLDDTGRIVNESALDYRIPTIGDVPREMVSLTIENEDGPGPSGAKGMGEGGIFAIAPAVSEAIFQATGVRMRELPFSPERVWRALRSGKSDNIADRRTS